MKDSFENPGRNKEEEDNSSNDKIEIITPIGSEGRKISEGELEKTKKSLKDLDEIKDIKLRREKGELLTSVEIAKLNMDEMGRKKDEVVEESDLEKELVQSKKTSERVDKNEELQESWTDLEDTRNEYIRLHQAYLREGLLGKVRSALGISPKGEMSDELKEAKEKYDLAKKRYALNETKSSLEKYPAGLTDEEKLKKFEEIKNKIFNIVVLDEQEYLQDARAESHPPKERGIFMKSYDRWTSLSKTKRLIYSTVMVAGVAGFASLAVPVTTSAAALGMGGVAGKKLLRGSFGMLFSGLAGKIFDKQIAGKKEEIKQTADVSTETARLEFDLNNLEEIENQYKDAIEQERKGNRNILIRKALVMGGAGITSSMGLGMADNALAGTSVVNDTQEFLKSSVEDKSILKEESVLDVDAGANTDYKYEGEVDGGEVLTGAQAEDFIETAQKGDSIWKMAEDQLEKHYGEKFSGLEEAQKTYLIDAIKDKIAENPENFGMNDVDDLKIGQEVDFSKAL